MIFPLMESPKGFSFEVSVIMEYLDIASFYASAASLSEVPTLLIVLNWIDLWRLDFVETLKSS